MGYLDYIPQAINVTYDNTVSFLGTGDTQSAIDELALKVASGPSGVAVTSSVPTSTTSAIPIQLDSMTIIPPSAGNYEVIFSAQFQGSFDTTIYIYVDAIQIPTSQRTAAGSTQGYGNFVMTTTDKVNVLVGQAINIFWGTTDTAVCLGRNMSIIKVT